MNFLQPHYPIVKIDNTSLKVHLIHGYRQAKLEFLQKGLRVVNLGRLPLTGKNPHGNVHS